ncbi:MAG: hypothetical protein Unbinned400contig1000_18 [Prokaryotic dsDNA virus sp.]|nr:MAG: hypothetical protein Unbinned400contig1000_18 [Prokaryotic dsDNA virus sp.]|tara:strand:+ start:9275 stop:9568 length:294 start_codon:yes stop_codon:yes gene_type:complete
MAIRKQTSFTILGRETGGLLSDIAENATITNGPSRYGRTKLNEMMRAAAKIGTLYTNAGDPAGEIPIAAGSLCFDTTNNDLYVCVARAAGTWTALAE